MKRVVVLVISVLLVLSLALSACAPVPAPTPAPAETQIAPSETLAPTPEITRSYPSPFTELYFGAYQEGGQPTIVIAVNGNRFEKENPGCTVPTVNGSHESQLNVLYNPNVPDLAAAFMVD
ncbi:MAG: hypothetical protein U1B80_03740, partial [Anaerolineaceae bacterium]|nr:hypothetical protein [Anaerolineaceae bacterium]